MSDFDEKLNSLLSNPEAMGQIMQLAQSLSGNSNQQPSQPPQPQQPPPPPPVPPSGSNPFSAIDPGALLRLLPLLQELGEQNTNTHTLLSALRPYLKPERQGKVDQALQLARLICVGKKFLANREE